MTPKVEKLYDQIIEALSLLEDQYDAANDATKAKLAPKIDALQLQKAELEFDDAIAFGKELNRLSGLLDSAIEIIKNSALGLDTEALDKLLAQLDPSAPPVPVSAPAPVAQASSDAAPVQPAASTWHVNPAKAAQLTLRTAPAPAAKIVLLPSGTRVDKLAVHATKPDWWKVNAHIGGSEVPGYVKASYLAQGIMPEFEPAISDEIPPAHLRKAGKKRTMSSGRAFPLDEPGMPQRGSGSASEKAAGIVKIIKYLNPAKSSHKRYKAGGGNTFCNIYAYDFCQRCGEYLPRVWWTNKALKKIKNGEKPGVLYGKTVRELNANMLHDWFIDYGGGFGWHRTFNVDDLQSAANDGKVAIIVAKRKNLARSGHINAVVPEHAGLKAVRSGGAVVRPLQSQAGSVNFTAKVPGKRWWLGGQFQSFAFWIND